MGLVGKVSDASASVLGGVFVPGGTKVTECGSGPAISHVTFVPFATLIDDGRNSSTAMFGSFGSFTPATSEISPGTATARGVAAWAVAPTATSVPNAIGSASNAAQATGDGLHDD